MRRLGTLPFCEHVLAGNVVERKIERTKVSNNGLGEVCIYDLLVYRLFAQRCNQRPAVCDDGSGDSQEIQVFHNRAEDPSGGYRKSEVVSFAQFGYFQRCIKASISRTQKSAVQVAGYKRYALVFFGVHAHFPISSSVSSGPVARPERPDGRLRRPPERPFRPESPPLPRPPRGLLGTRTR